MPPPPGVDYCDSPRICATATTCIVVTTATTNVVHFVSTTTTFLCCHCFSPSSWIHRAQCHHQTRICSMGPSFALFGWTIPIDNLDARTARPSPPRGGIRAPIRCSFLTPCSSLERRFLCRSPEDPYLFDGHLPGSPGLCVVAAFSRVVYPRNFCCHRHLIPSLPLADDGVGSQEHAHERSLSTDRGGLVDRHDGRVGKRHQEDRLDCRSGITFDVHIHQREQIGQFCGR